MAKKPHSILNQLKICTVHFCAGGNISLGDHLKIHTFNWEEKVFCNEMGCLISCLNVSYRYSRSLQGRKKFGGRDVVIQAVYQ